MLAARWDVWWDHVGLSPQGVGLKGRYPLVSRGHRPVQTNLSFS